MPLPARSLSQRLITAPGTILVTEVGGRFSRIAGSELRQAGAITSLTIIDSGRLVSQNCWFLACGEPICALNRARRAGPGVSVRAGGENGAGCDGSGDRALVATGITGYRVHRVGARLTRIPV